MPTHEPPRQLIQFLAKSGFISRPFWERFFFLGGKDCWKRRTWNGYLKKGYCKLHPERHLKDVYVLDGKNAEVRKTVSGRLVCPQRATNFVHDELLYEGVLVAERAGLISSWMSEGELRSVGNTVYRLKAKKGFSKYPDALIFAAKDKDALPIAIEYERTLKTARRYEDIIGAYGNLKDVGGILFVSEFPTLEHHIRAATVKHRYNPESPKVNFCSVEAWKVPTEDLLRPLYRYRTATVRPKAA